MTTSVNERPFKTFVCSYNYNGCRWGLDLMAEDFEDAQARLQAIAMGTVDGLLYVLPSRTMSALYRQACG